ncbi:flagellar basal body-associated FliL family protein [Marinobacter fonticola]|uniref:flagellar basal body-associated FliL family protein n=1 Tax=Marinobacter fonticola TaxID=2603215 RepID=UPI0011E68E02|nr:flagellar basal body-associated FliL family protein [Marinobacter fonticola]
MAENTEQAPAGKKGKLKLIIGLVVVIVLAVALSIGGTLWFLQSGDDAETQDGDADTAAAEAFEPSLYYSLDKPFIVTLASEERQRYMQIFVALQSRNQAALDAAQTHMPLLRSRLLTLFGAQDFQAMQTPEGKQALLEEALSTVNTVLEQEGAEPIDHILFENFVLQ